MKKILSAFLAGLMLLACAACGAPTDTTADVTEAPITDAPATDTPATDAPETNAPETELPKETQEIPDDPTFDADEKPDDGEMKKMVYEYDFTKGLVQLDGFTVEPTRHEITLGEGYKTQEGNGAVIIKDNEIKLKGKSIMVEADITFNTLPHKADGVTNFPLSIISWIRKTSSQTFYDWAFKLDDQGVIYVKDTTTPTSTKIEAGKRYTFGVLFNEIDGQIQIYLDGELVGARGFASRELIGSSIRIFDAGNEKARFDATLHSTRAYLCDETDMLKDAEQSIFDYIAKKPTAQLCFLGYTDKDALSYAVGEEMTFEIYLTADGEVVSAPYFYYSVEGEDGQKKTEGYVDGSKGHFTVKAKLSKPGAVRVKAFICDQNKTKQTKNNSPFYVNLDTTTPQKADLRFQGGAVAGLTQINAGGKIPADLETYWDGVVSECYKGDIKLLRFEELDPLQFDGGSKDYYLYLVEIEVDGGFATGYLTIPKNAGALKLRCNFVSYGNAKKPKPSFYSSTASFSICAHSYHLDDPSAIVPDKNGKSYGFYMPENNDRDTTYFKGMFVRNITALRFLKAYIGDASYGKIIFEGKTISPLGKWKKGDELYVQGGSQASFQSVGMAALDIDVTKASFGVPWFCDIGGDLVGRFSGWNPDYTDALMYYDSVALATLIGRNVEVTITAGLGDTTSEPSGVCAFYNALNCNVKMTMKQNREHTYDPPMAKSYTVSKTAK